MVQSGIYIIKNKKNNKPYVGSSLNIHKRLNNHKSLLRRGVHHSYKLQGSFNKHSEENFDFFMLEEVFFPINYNKKIKEEYLESLEQYYIDLYSAYTKGYNVSKFSNRGHHENTHEASIKSWETRRKRGNDNLSEGHKKNISISLTNNDKLKEALKKNGKKRRKKVYQYDLKGNFVREWGSIYDILESNSKLKYSGIKKSIRGEHRAYKKVMYSFSKHDNIEPYVRPIVLKLRTYVLKTNEQGIVLETFDTLSDVPENSGTIHSYIQQNKKYKGYFYSYGEQHW